MADRAVRFQRAMAPYEAGDIAGFPAAYAEKLVLRRIAAFHPPEPIVDILTAMDRAALVAFGKEHLGMTDEPPAEVSDDALRAAIRSSTDSAQLVAPAPKAEEPETDPEPAKVEEPAKAEEPAKGGKPVKK